MHFVISTIVCIYFIGKVLSRRLLNLLENFKRPKPAKEHRANRERGNWQYGNNRSLLVICTCTPTRTHTDKIFTLEFTKKKCNSLRWTVCVSVYPFVLFYNISLRHFSIFIFLPAHTTQISHPLSVFFSHSLFLSSPLFFIYLQL